MNLIKLLPVVLSMLILAAHFYRYGNIVLVIGVLVCLIILLIRKPWVARLLQAVLVVGGIEWIRTAVMFVRIRQNMGAPWARLALILGGVALLTMCSALVFRFKSLRERYKLMPEVGSKERKIERT